MAEQSLKPCRWVPGVCPRPRCYCFPPSLRRASVSSRSSVYFLSSPVALGTQEQLTWITPGPLGGIQCLSPAGFQAPGSSPAEPAAVGTGTRKSEAVLEEFSCSTSPSLSPPPPPSVSYFHIQMSPGAILCLALRGKCATPNFVSALMVQGGGRWRCGKCPAV